MDVEEKRAPTPTRRPNRNRFPGTKVYGHEYEAPKRIVKSKELAAKIPSIEPFMFLYATEGKYFLPPRDFIT